MSSPIPPRECSPERRKRVTQFLGLEHFDVLPPRGNPGRHVRRFVARELELDTPAGQRSQLLLGMPRAFTNERRHLRREAKDVTRGGAAAVNAEGGVGEARGIEVIRRLSPLFEHLHLTQSLKVEE